MSRALPRSPRQLQVWEMMLDGLSANEMADRLGIASGTVTSHVSRVLALLGCHNKTQAAVLFERYRNQSLFNAYCASHGVPLMQIDES